MGICILGLYIEAWPSILQKYYSLTPHGITANQIQWRLGAPGDPAAPYIPSVYGEASTLARNKSIVKPANPDLNVNSIHIEYEMKCTPHIT